MATGTWDSPNSEENLTVTLNTTDFSLESWGSATAKRVGNTVYLRINGFKAKSAAPAGTSKQIATFSGGPSKANIVAPILTNDGSVEGRGILVEGSNSVSVSSYSNTNIIRYLNLVFPV